MIDLSFSLEICRPLEEHAQLVMAWRNDPETLTNSYHHEPKIWESFWLEFRDNYFIYSTLPPLFLLFEGTRVAFLRYRVIPNPKGTTELTASISINVAP